MRPSGDPASGDALVGDAPVTAVAAEPRTDDGQARSARA
jgi:hypothetical protein